jgi:ribonuclease P protein component
MHFYLRFSSSDEIKLVISVSKKISKKAVVRNTIKRRTRAVMRDLIKDMKPGTYMIVAKSGADKIKGKELEKELLMLIRSIRN